MVHVTITALRARHQHPSLLTSAGTETCTIPSDYVHFVLTFQWDVC